MLIVVDTCCEVVMYGVVDGIGELFIREKGNILIVVSACNVQI